MRLPRAGRGCHCHLRARHCHRSPSLTAGNIVAATGGAGGGVWRGQSPGAHCQEPCAAGAWWVGSWRCPAGRCAEGCGGTAPDSALLPAPPQAEDAHAPCCPHRRRTRSCGGSWARVAWPAWSALWAPRATNWPSSRLPTQVGGWAARCGRGEERTRSTARPSKAATGWCPLLGQPAQELCWLLLPARRGGPLAPAHACPLSLPHPQPSLRAGGSCPRAGRRGGAAAAAAAAQQAASRGRGEGGFVQMSWHAAAGAAVAAGPTAFPNPPERPACCAGPPEAAVPPVLGGPGRGRGGPMPFVGGRGPPPPGWQGPPPPARGGFYPPGRP